MMTPTASPLAEGEAPRRAAQRRRSPSIGELLFRGVTAGFAVALLVLAAGIVWVLGKGAGPAFRAFGLEFLWRGAWDPTNQEFGAVAFVAGSLLTSLLAILLAVPLALGIAITLSEIRNEWIRDGLSFVVELLAAIPSVVYGLWAVYILAPIMAHAVDPAIKASPLGWLPFFGTPALGFSLLTAALVLAVMILPIIAAISREVLLAVPVSQREAGLALGLTRWEVTRRIVLSYGRGGIFGAVLLGLGRAIGETIAVTMVVGNQANVTWDLFQSGYTMASVIANEFGEAVNPLHVASLYEIGLVLFAVSLLVNISARLLVRGLRHEGVA
jgi:phosphate transport system permease protein